MNPQSSELYFFVSWVFRDTRLHSCSLHDFHRCAITVLALWCEAHYLVNVALLTLNLHADTHLPPPPKTKHFSNNGLEAAQRGMHILA